MNKIINTCYYSNDVTGELVWFNHMVTEHVSSSEDEQAENKNQPQDVF